MNNLVTSGFPVKKFLFVSLESLSGDLAWNLTKEGHKVKAYIKSKTDSDVYDGFIEKTSNWGDQVEWADVIVFDDVEFGSFADNLRKNGKKVIGGSTYTDRLEIDREFGQNELTKHGINTLPSWQFDDYDKALEFLRQNRGRYVFKPSGNTPSAEKALLFLGEEEDGRDLIELIEKNVKVFRKKAKTFILQKFISGVEVAVGAFFNGHDFIYPINVNFEHKRIFPGNVGPFGGEMGTLMYWSEQNLLFKETLLKMLPSLRESKYVGYFDLNCIVNGKGIYPLEFTSRFGYPTIHIQQEGIITPLSEWIFRLAKGEDFTLKTKKGYQLGVRILVPSYFARDDSEEVDMYKDLAITFKPGFNLEGVHIEDVKDDNGVWRIAGTSGVLLVITGSGSTIDEARRLVYNKIRNISIPNMFYRTDIGLRWNQESDRLHTWGYLR